MKLLNNYSINTLLKYIRFENLVSLNKILSSHKDCRKFIDKESATLPKTLDNSFFINEAYSKYCEEMCNRVTLDSINKYFLDFDSVIGIINLALLELATPSEAITIANSKYVSNSSDIESQIVFSGFECFILGRISTISTNYGGLLRQLSYSKSFRNNVVHKSITLNNLRIFYMCEFISSCCDLLSTNGESLLKLLKSNHSTHSAFSLDPSVNKFSNFMLGV